MKNYRKLLLFLTLLIFVGIEIIKAQAPPPPPSSSSSTRGTSSNQAPSAGGSAPLGSGLSIMLGLGIAYGAYSYMRNKNSSDEK
jgi:hypothetical protein